MLPPRIKIMTTSTRGNVRGPLRSVHFKKTVTSVSVLGNNLYVLTSSQPAFVAASISSVRFAVAQVSQTLVQTTTKLATSSTVKPI